MGKISPSFQAEASYQTKYSWDVWNCFHVGLTTQVCLCGCFFLLAAIGCAALLVASPSPLLEQLSLYILCGV